FVSGTFSIADIALFPHMVSARAMEVEFSAQDHPNLGRWFKEMRALPICAADAKRARDYVVTMKDRDIEKRRIFWRVIGLNGCWHAVFMRGFSMRSTKTAWHGPVPHCPRQ